MLSEKRKKGTQAIKAPLLGVERLRSKKARIVWILIVSIGTIYLFRHFRNDEFIGDVLGALTLTQFHSLEQEAKWILKKHPLIGERLNVLFPNLPWCVIDGHNDLLILIRGRFKNHISDQTFTSLFENGGLDGHVDLPRIKSGRMGGAFWSAFMPCPVNGSDFSNANYAEIVRGTLQQLDVHQQLQVRYPRIFTPSATSAQAELTFKNSRLISPIGIEGLHQIGNSPATLRLYHSLGARYATLTWNCHNIYADAAIIRDESGNFGPSKPLWHGISEEGREMVYEMNRLGMLVDLAHVSKDTMIDALMGSKKWGKTWKGSIAPPIFSHSSAYALCPHPRNVPDDVLQLVKQRNSLVMINFSADFISCRESDSGSKLPETVPESATLAQVVKHIRHIGDLIGYDYVGIGTDFDGISDAPQGLEDVSKFPDLVVELLRQGVRRQDVVKVIGGNLLRVWAEADAIAGMLKPWRQPLEDKI
jgi:membrane dipeptidase